MVTEAVPAGKSDWVQVAQMRGGLASRPSIDGRASIQAWMNKARASAALGPR